LWDDGASERAVPTGRRKGGSSVCESSRAVVVSGRIIKGWQSKLSHDLWKNNTV